MSCFRRSGHIYKYPSHFLWDGCSQAKQVPYPQYAHNPLKSDVAFEWYYINTSYTDTQVNYKLYITTYCFFIHTCSHLKNHRHAVLLVTLLSIVWSFKNHTNWIGNNIMIHDIAKIASNPTCCIWRVMQMSYQAIVLTLWTNPVLFWFALCTQFYAKFLRIVDYNLRPYSTKNYKAIIRVTVFMSYYLSKSKNYFCSTISWKVNTRL